jgi:hypothetical protein
MKNITELSKKELKEIVFEHFDEVEYYKINKGFVKATLEELSRLYQQGYSLGYRQAISDMEDQLATLHDLATK